MRAFTDLETTLLVDYVNIFALSPDPPNVERTTANCGKTGVASCFANALVLGATWIGQF
jgi:hypothetical protein